MLNKNALIAIAVATFAIGCSQADSGVAKAETVSGDVEYVAGDVVLGDAKAPVEIIEYASTSCGHCRTFHKTILPTIKSEFIETGKAKLIFRDLPTFPPAVAAAGGALARCAGKDKYHEMLDELFTSQYEIMEAAQRRSAIDALIESAARVGMDEKTVRACVSSTDVLGEIQRTSDLAHEAGVTGTPTLFINGERVSGKDMNLTGITNAINKALGVEPEPAETPEETAPEEETLGSSEAAPAE